MGFLRGDAEKAVPRELGESFRGRGCEWDRKGLTGNICGTPAGGRPRST